MSYRWLGIASFGVPEKLGCAGLPLNSRQKELCKRKPYLLPSIREGARLGIQECRSQFRHERWNCLVATATTAPLATGPLFGYELSSGESPRPLGMAGRTKRRLFCLCLHHLVFTKSLNRTFGAGKLGRHGPDPSVQVWSWRGAFKRAVVLFFSLVPWQSCKKTESPPYRPVELRAARLGG